MAQQRTWNFGDAFTAAKGNAALHALHTSGRYRGYNVTVSDTDEIKIAANGFALLPDGILVTEDSPIYLTFSTLPTVATSYSVTLRHVDTPTLGGAAATYAIETGHKNERFDDGITLAWIEHPGGGVALQQSHITMVEAVLNSAGPPSGEASGDLTDNYPGPIVKGIRGRPITTGTPDEGDTFYYDGNRWEYRPVRNVVGDGIPAAVWTMATAPTPSSSNFVGGLRDIGAAGEVQKIILSQETAGSSGNLVIELYKIASDGTITRITKTGLTLLSPSHGNLARVTSTEFRSGTTNIDPSDRLAIRVTGAPAVSPEDITVTVLVSDAKLPPPPPESQKAIVQLIDFTVVGNTWTYVGSVHLVPGVLKGADCSFLLGTTTTSDTVAIQLRKFGTSIPVASVSATGLLQKKVLAADAVIFEENFYDIYIKTQSVSAIGTLKGMRLVYDPANRTDVQQAISDSTIGTTAKYLGSIYLPAGSLQIGSSAILGTDNASETATLELRRFTNGNLAGSLTATGTLQQVSPSSAIIIPYPDFYDLYLKASSPGITAIIGGISFVVIG